MLYAYVKFWCLYSSETLVHWLIPTLTRAFPILNPSGDNKVSYPKKKMIKGVKAAKVAEPACMLKSRFAVARLRDIVLGFNDHSLLSKIKFVHIYPIYHIIHHQLGHHGAVEGSGITI